MNTLAETASYLMIDCSGGKVALGQQGQDNNFWVENWVFTLHWEQLWRRNDRGPLSEDVGRLVQ